MTSREHKDQNTARQLALIERRKTAGLRRVQLWITEDKYPEVKAIEKECLAKNL